MAEIGTVKELGAKDGDELEFVKCVMGIYSRRKGDRYVVRDDVLKGPKGALFQLENQHIWRIIRRASSVRVGSVGPISPVHTEILPGTYGHIWIDDPIEYGVVRIGLLSDVCKKTEPVRLTAGELKAMISTLTLIANAMEE